MTVPPTNFNRYIRPHWQIENRLHWKPDVVFREDRQHTRHDNGPLNLATARKLALQVLRPWMRIAPKINEKGRDGTMSI